MSVMERNSRRRISLGESHNALFNLVAINAVIFVLLGFTALIYKATGSDLLTFRHGVLDWFILPADPATLLSRPWTLLTYVFSHMDIWMVISNMLWLWAFGFIMQDLTGNGQVIPIYLYGGLAGALAFLLAANIIPGLRPLSHSLQLMGAGTGVVALAVATTMVSPEYRIFPMLNGGIPLWVLTIIFVAIDLTGLAGAPLPYYMAHLAGAAMGFVFVRQMRRGNDLGTWMHVFYDWLLNLFNPARITKDTKRIRRELFYKAKGNPPYTKTPLITQQKVDEILDKISQKGYHFLSEEERDILKRASEGDL